MSHERDGQDDRKMLNLEVGGFYKLRCGHGVEYVGQVMTKDTDDPKRHTYFFCWPSSKTHLAVGMYMWDTGVANQGHKFFNFSSAPIVECRELTIKEKFDLIKEFIKYNQQWKAFIVEPRKGKLRKDKNILWKTTDKVCYSTI